MTKLLNDINHGFTPATPNTGDGGKLCLGSDFEGL